MSDYLERAEESRERNAGLAYEEYHDERSATMTSDTAVIRRVFHGGTEDVSYADFAYDAVQDYQVAREIALGMLAGDGTHTYTADELSMYFETFEILDRDELVRQMGESDE